MEYCFRNVHLIAVLRVYEITVIGANRSSTLDLYVHVLLLHPATGTGFDTQEVLSFTVGCQQKVLPVGAPSVERKECDPAPIRTHPAISERSVSFIPATRHATSR